ncbi:MAG: hypothetical protein ACFFE8_04900 [Candidatus Heimdallarchaeota archaeon]
MGFLTNFDFKGKISTAIILFISAAAFISGFYQTELVVQETNLKEQITEWETQVRRMESLAQQIMTIETPKDTVVQNMRATVIQLDAELEMLNNTLTVPQRRAYTNQILLLITAINRQSKFYLTYTLDNYFAGKPLSAKYPITTVDEEGFEYYLTKQDWINATKNRNLVVEEVGLRFYIQQTLNLANYNLVFNFINNSVNLASSEISTIVRVNLVAALSAIRLPIFQIQAQIADQTAFVGSLNTLVNQFSLGVSLTAVAVVLAGLMANRISEKGNLKNIQKIQDNEYKEQRDLISIPILFFAAIIAIVGVVLPIIVPFIETYFAL